MLIDVKVPVLAESVAEATLMNWHKQAGEQVKRGDTLIDIETDKVTLEVAAPNDGTITEIIRGDGETVASDEVIARIDTDAGAGATERPASESKPEPEPLQQSLPVGDMPAVEPKLSPAVRALLEENKLDPAQVESTGPSGRLTKEDVLKHLKQKSGAAPPKPTVAPSPVKSPPQAPGDREVGSAPPAAKPVPAAEPAPTTKPAAKPAPVAGAAADGRMEERVPMTRLRRRAAERLLAAQQENAILTTFNEVNMQPVMDLRSRYKEKFEKSHGVRLGFMSFFTKAAVEALKRFPAVNASIDGQDIVYHGYFDIGMAVSSPRGLVVPIVRNADLLSFAGVESKIREFGEKARDGKLTIEELTGGTFTITNGGVFGSLLSTPILNPPQSAILGMHKIQERPMVENGQVVVRPMMYLALSYDHRIIDGREAVQFLVAIKEQIEDPARLLLQV